MFRNLNVYLESREFNTLAGVFYLFFNNNNALLFKLSFYIISFTHFEKFGSDAPMNIKKKRHIRLRVNSCLMLLKMNNYML